VDDDGDGDDDDDDGGEGECDDDDDDDAEERKDERLSPSLFWTLDPNHRFAVESLPAAAATPTAAAAPATRRVITTRDEQKALALYDTLNGASWAEMNVFGGFIEGAGAQRVFRGMAELMDGLIAAELREGKPAPCREDMTVLDVGCGSASLAAFVLLWFQTYIGVEVVAQTVRCSVEQLQSGLPLSSRNRVYIALCNALRLPPVVSGVHVVYCYLSTMPVEEALFVHLLEMCVRSPCIWLFVFHSRPSLRTASPLELLCAAFDPEIDPFDRRLERASEARLKTHLTSGHASAALGGRLQLRMQKWIVNNADANGTAVGGAGQEACYAVTIDANFRQHCDIGNLRRNPAVSALERSQRNGVYVHAEAAMLEASALPDVGAGPNAIEEQCERSHWHYVQDTAFIAEEPDGSFPVPFDTAYPTRSHY
jgi:hypothetical protein